MHPGRSTESIPNSLVADPDRRQGTSQTRRSLGIRRYSRRPHRQQENWDLIQSIVEDASGAPITERELELAKNKICAGILLASERPSNRLFSVGGTWLSRDQYETAAQVSQHYRSVSLEDVQKTFENLKDRTAVRVSVGPQLDS